jgi:transketolase C-terminal domain/subunit
MLKDIQVTGKKDTRSGFGDGITELGRTNKNVVALTADLAGSLKLNTFIKENPVARFHSPPLLRIFPPEGYMTRSGNQ